MNLKSISLVNLFSHGKTQLHVPPQGVVLITGPNGAGKSAILETPCVALFGKTLRGTPPWQPDGRGYAEVTSDVAFASRLRNGGKTTLQWKRAGGSDPVYENTTKAQEALEHVIGSFDVWRRSRVFSSSDASHFTLATDSERKKLLETLLDLARFDEAYEACRADLKGVATVAQAQFREVEAKQAARAEMSRQERSLKDEFARLPPADATTLKTMKGNLEKLDRLLKTSNEDQDRIQKELRVRDRDMGSFSAEAKAARYRLSVLGDQATCASCGQAIDPKMRTKLMALVEKEQKVLEAAKAKHEADTEDLSNELDELRSEAKGLAAKRGVVASEIINLEHTLQLHNRLLRQSAELQGRIGEADEAIEKQQAALLGLQSTVAELEAVSTVLGLRGVRAQVLGKALHGVEMVANHWLKRLPTEEGRILQLQLRSYTEKKTGGVVDSIAIDVEKAGGGFGYAAASAGERRRIDVALVFGLSAVAISAQEADAVSRLGGKPSPPTGTLFFDEVMDALDDVGVEAMAAALQEMAKDRAILVVSHSVAVAAALKPVARWHVDQGKVTVQ